MFGLIVSLNYYIADITPLENAATNNEWYGTESHECVALVKPWIPGKTTKKWSRSDQVKGNYVSEGTCIASFQYSSSKRFFYDGAIGGHAAVFVSQNSQGITVYDQWRTQPCHKRVIRFQGDGSKQNDGNEFYVIE
ncbi:BPSL0067_family protein [Hexamita inflata]|uniref:BPSL0067 family protein n=1 Tax=Hexamita inflata TaxID=28002 RepID=A0AA86QY15_9EUKA|nr:BPSL0067 family protein [Hexamita inflata]CAI9967828.1 BPSL0067 family protein [Hexamita inflata]CAI9967833.1 BPSL0067 family protein [Hexamita inflata]